MATGTEGTGLRLGAPSRLLQVALAALILVGSAARTDAMRSAVPVRGADPAQRELVRWATARYQMAGLELPPVEVRFHPDASACGGNSGFSAGGRIDMCTDSPSIAYLRATLLHELGHAWLELHATPSLRARFMRLRGLGRWSSPEVPWGLRGMEQAAEILAWGLGDGSVAALVPDDDPAGLADAFGQLTGGPPLNPEVPATS